MNQKSSLRKILQFVSHALTANSVAVLCCLQEFYRDKFSGFVVAAASRKDFANVFEDKVHIDLRAMIKRSHDYLSTVSCQHGQFKRVGIAH